MATLYGITGRSARQIKDADQKRDNKDKVKEFASNMTSHIPTEVVAVFALGIASAPDYTGYWMIFCWAGAVALRWWATDGDGKIGNIILAGLAFPIWAFALGGDLLGWKPDPQLTNLSVLGFSIIGGLLYNNK